MDASNYRTLAVSRGLVYNYYATSARAGKPTLLLCHGFPSTSYDWRHFVPFFESRGYGLIVPDMLGYGGTSKPTDPAEYVPSKMSQDLVNLLDAEGVSQAIAVGYDWGSKAISRLASYYPARFIAYAYLVVAHMPPPKHTTDTHTFTSWLSKVESVHSDSELWGYWSFFTSDEAPGIIANHMDAFISIILPHEHHTWNNHLKPGGGMTQALLDDFSAPLPPYISQADADAWKATLLKNGLAAPICWYKVITSGLQDEDDKQIPPERFFPPKECPVFYGAATHDPLCLPAIGHEAMRDPGFAGHDVTIKDFDSDHWLILSKAEEVCEELEKWIDTVVLAPAST